MRSEWHCFVHCNLHNFSGCVRHLEQLHAQSPFLFPIVFGINPLWGNCQEYKIEKNAILQERLLSEKRSTFVNYNLTLSESIASLIMKNKSESLWHTEKFAKNRLKKKSAGRMRTKRQNRKVCSSLRSISTSLGHGRTSKLPQQGRVLSDWRIDFQTTCTLSSRLQLESSAGKPFTSSSTTQTPRQELRTTSPQGAGMKGSATSEGQKDIFFCGTKVFSKRQHDRLSLSCMHAKNGDAVVTITTENRVGVHLSRYRWKSIDGLTKDLLYIRHL